MKAIPLTQTHQMSSVETFPIMGELWSHLEGILSANAKRLVEDIARKQGVDPKELWGKIKPKIRVGLLDIDIPDDTPVYCSNSHVHSDCAIKTRCRAPCLLGFTACDQHAGKPESVTTTSTLPEVTRVFDDENKHYFVNAQGIAMDRNGRPKGTVSEDGRLLLFEMWSKPPASASNKA